jgi:hypothetical protein
VDPKARYVNRSGEYYAGIPARDLTDDDWERLSEEQRALVAAETNVKGRVMYRMRPERRAMPEAAGPDESSDTRPTRRGKAGE